MNAYEQFEKAQAAFEDFEFAHLLPKHDDAMAYLDAAIEAHHQGVILNEQLYFVWRQVKPYLKG